MSTRGDEALDQIRHALGNNDVSIRLPLLFSHPGRAAQVYSYGVQVIAVSPDEVYWRSFSTRTHDVGFATREEWATGFRYGDHMPGKHTMHLQRRGVIPPGQGASGG